MDWIMNPIKKNHSTTAEMTIQTGQQQDISVTATTQDQYSLRNQPDN